MTYGTDRTVVSVTIAVGASLSGAVNVNGRRLVGIVLPTNAEGTSITLQALMPDGTYGNVHDEAGTEYAVTLAAGRYTAIKSGAVLESLGTIKVRTGTAGVPTVQAGADTLVYLILE